MSVGRTIKLSLVDGGAYPDKIEGGSCSRGGE